MAHNIQVNVTTPQPLAGRTEVSIPGRGQRGLDGKTVRSSEGKPADDFGAVEDFCIDTVAQVIYGPKGTAENPWGDGVSLIGPGGAEGPASVSTEVLLGVGANFEWRDTGFSPTADVPITSSNGFNGITDTGLFGDGSSLTGVTANTARYLNDVDQGASFSYNGFAWAPQQNHYIQSYNGNNGFNDAGFFGDGSGLTNVFAYGATTADAAISLAYVGASFYYNEGTGNWSPLASNISNDSGTAGINDTGLFGDGSQITGIAASGLNSGDTFFFNNNSVGAVTGWGPSGNIEGSAIKSANGYTWMDNDGFHGNGESLTGLATDLIAGSALRADSLYGTVTDFGWTSNFMYQPLSDAKVGSSNTLNYFDDSGFHGDGSNLTGVQASQLNDGGGNHFFLDPGISAWRPDGPYAVTSANGVNGVNDTYVFGDGSGLYNMIIEGLYHTATGNGFGFDTGLNAWAPAGSDAIISSANGANYLDNYGFHGDGSSLTGLANAFAAGVAGQIYDFSASAGSFGINYTYSSWAPSADVPITSYDGANGFSGAGFFGNGGGLTGYAGDFHVLQADELNFAGNVFTYSSGDSAWKPTADTLITSENGLVGFANGGLFGDGSLITNISADFGDYNFQVFVDAGDGPESAQDLLVGNTNGRLFDQYGNANFANTANTSTIATYANHLQGPIITEASVTPTDNGDLVFEATSDTSLTVKYRGSDGVVRSVVLTLS